MLHSRELVHCCVLHFIVLHFHSVVSKREMFYALIVKNTRREDGEHVGDMKY